jgi:hypothetical protein
VPVCLDRWELPVSSLPWRSSQHTHTMVSPLLTAPKTHTSQRDNERRNVLKGMGTTIQSIMRSCKTFQTNKRRKRKYGYLPPKTSISNLWECLCVDLIGSYTCKGKYDLQIDFIALTMIDPTSSWFEIVELPIVT